MEITTDILLYGKEWEKAIDKYSNIFTKQPHFQLYMLATSIGILHDEIIKSEDIKTEENPKNVPRNVLQNRGDNLDVFFQAAIMTTKTRNLTEDERLELAFGEKTDFNKLSFLTEFANYGVTILNKQIGGTDIITVEYLNEYLFDEIQSNSQIKDYLSDEILLEEEY